MSGRVRLQHCAACGHWYAMPRASCACGPDQRLLVEPVAGRGTVYSSTVTHQAMDRSLDDRVPYQTVLVELVEGPRVLAMVGGAPTAAPIPIGAAVSVVDAQPADDERVPTAAVLVVPVERQPPVIAGDQ